MEDSYTVHRRRKAAARRREKTPEPARRHGDVEVPATDEEEEEARARMERLVQETERLEELDEARRQQNVAEKTTLDVDKQRGTMRRAVSPEVRRKEFEARTKEEVNVEAKVTVEVTSGVGTRSERTDRAKVEKSPRVIDVPEGKTEENAMEVKKASLVLGQAPKDRYKESEEGAVRKSSPKEENSEVRTSSVSRPVKPSSDLDRERSPNAAIEKPKRSPKKALGPETSEKNRRSGEWSGDAVAKSEESSRKKSSERAAGDDEAVDKNRREAEAVEAARESDVQPVARRLSGNGGRVEAVKQRDVKSEETRRASAHVEDAEEPLRARKRDVTSPTKSKSSEASKNSTSKRGGKERNEGTGYTTDSSETEEIKKTRVVRRTKSPEGTKSTRILSSRKTPSRSRATTDTDGDAEELDRSRRVERRSASRRRHSSDSEDEGEAKQNKSSTSQGILDKREAPKAPSRHGEKSRGTEKRSSSRMRGSNDTDEELRTMRKSGTFPADPPRDRSPLLVRSNSEMKKMIIPLSDDSLIEDFERAQREYLKRERGILDRDPFDDYVDPRMEAAFRRRRFSVVGDEGEQKASGEQQVTETPKRSWFGWIPFFGKKADKKKEDDVGVEVEEKKKEEGKKVEMKIEEQKKDEEKKVIEESPKKVTIFEFFRSLGDFLAEFRAFVEQNPREMRKIRILRNRCIAELILTIIYCGLGAFVFRFTEGAFETFYKCGVKRVKRDFLDSLWNFSHNMREEDWKSMARRKLMEFEEQLHTAHEAGVHSYSGQKSWSFLNAVLYCLTVITTIGYGHISPSTTTGRAITIVYAIFGIPMFLIILADFGKLFTRGIKFLWAFVRRLYYTGSCRRVRRTVPVQEVMKGVQLVYDLATFRRPSQMNPEEIEEMQKQQNQTQTVLNLDGNAPASAQPPDTPGTPAMSTFAIDDEFNLPISVAIIILLVYIFVGATVYNFWEHWGFFESFYFVFISMSTIGFGDYVPKHPIYMMLSIVYLVFGLALTSMCINVVQVMLSDSFKQASQKIGATIGFEVAEEDGSIQPAAPPPVEIADVHTTIKESDSKENIAPKAKQEDVEL